MIPRGFIQEWRAVAPWPEFRQVEQDLVISRALCDLFSSDRLKGRIAFRGGTAINKFLFPRPLRYSEDIDLVQLKPEPVGVTLDGIREVLVRELVPAYLASRDILWFLDDLIAASVCHASIRRFRPISNDPDDDCMIELALTADVQVLVTHNKAHFRDLPARGIEVLTPAEILRFLNL